MNDDQIKKSFGIGFGIGYKDGRNDRPEDGQKALGIRNDQKDIHKGAFIEGYSNGYRKGQAEYRNLITSLIEESTKNEEG